jgi:hypothetical protein
MLRLFLSRYFLLLLLFGLYVKGIPAQEQEVLLPPRPDYAPPPDPSTLPPPPELEWEPLPPPAAGEQSSPVPPQPVLIVPPPQADAALNPPLPADDAPFVPGQSGLPQVEVAKSGVEVWREESESPQMPARRGPQFEQAYVTGTEPLLVRLQFDPLAAGKTVVVKPGHGVTVDPPQTEFHVGPTGECVVSIVLDPGFIQSRLTVYCDGVRTSLPLMRAPLSVVEAQEALTEGGQ